MEPSVPKRVARTQQNGKLLNSRGIIKRRPLTFPFPALLPLSWILGPLRIGYTFPRETINVATPGDTQLVFLFGDAGWNAKEAEGGTVKQRKRRAGWAEGDNAPDNRARNDLLFSRPIKSAICWPSEKTTGVDKR